MDLFGYECTKCSGLWIPGQTLAYFLSLHSQTPRHGELLERVRKGEPSSRPLRCPSCSDALLRNLSAVGVELDLCATCGGCYLDKPEVDIFISTGRHRDSSPGDSLLHLLLLFP